jgi:heme exporter protein D
MGIHGFFTFIAIGETLFATLIGLIMLAMAVKLISTLLQKPKGVK